MRQKIVVLIIMLTSCLAFWPSQTKAAAAGSSLNLAANTSKPQIRIEIGHRHDRGLHRGWYNGRRVSYYYYDRRDPMFVRQTYWVNGVGYTRWVRNY